MISREMLSNVLFGAPATPFSHRAARLWSAGHALIFRCTRSAKNLSDRR